MLYGRGLRLTRGTLSGGLAVNLNACAGGDSAKTMPDTKQRLIDAATRRFYRDGFRNVGLDQILDDVGISKTFSTPASILEMSRMSFTSRMSRSTDSWQNAISCR